LDNSSLSRQKLVSVFTAGNETEARMVQELLRNSGIESLINAESAPGLFPVNFGELAKQSLMVVESDAARAKTIIAEQYESGTELPAE
jgi:hypothetical protein